MKSESKPTDAYLFILPWSITSLGGVNQVVENLYGQMETDGRYKPILLVNSWHDRNIRKEKIKGIYHYFFRLRSPFYHPNKIKNLLVFFVEFIGTMKRLNSFLNYNKVSVINPHYCNLFLINISILRCLKLFKGKFILSFHGGDFLNAKNSRGLENYLWRVLLRSSDKIIACSNSLKDDIINFDQRCQDRVISIHNGINNNLQLSFDSECTDLDIATKKYVLNVATLEHKKGQDILLKSFKVIVNDFEDVFLVIIGRPAGVENQLKRLIDSLGLSKKVYLYEGLSHDQVMTFMSNALIFALPSRYEPFGIVVLEAGSFGVPVVASKVGGIQEILSNNQTGILCEPEDVEALAEAMARLLRMPEERERLGTNLRDHVLKNFSWKKTYDNYLNVIEEI